MDVDVALNPYSGSLIMESVLTGAPVLVMAPIRAVALKGVLSMARHSDGALGITAQEAIENSGLPGETDREVLLDRLEAALALRKDGEQKAVEVDLYGLVEFEDA